jgi:SAM-dependent methyltransferase
VALAEIGAREVVGIDTSPRMIDEAGRRAQAHRVADRCRFVCAAFPAVPVEGPFDCVFAMGVLDFVADPEPFLAAVRRLARRRAVVSLPARDDPWFPQRWLRHRWQGVPLFAHTRAEIERMVSGWRLAHVRIERLHRDYLLVVETVPLPDRPPA